MFCKPIFTFPFVSTPYGRRLLSVIARHPVADPTIGAHVRLFRLGVFQVRSHCAYPCQCANRDPVCEPGVPHTRDGCGCCPVCARQDGDPCDGIAVCDQRKGLVCQYDDYYSPAGICRGRFALSGFGLYQVSTLTTGRGQSCKFGCPQTTPSLRKYGVRLWSSNGFRCNL